MQHTAKNMQAVGLGIVLFLAVIRSELGTAVYDAVYAAGMAFPFPQREVRILGDETAQKSAGPRPAGSDEK